MNFDQTYLRAQTRRQFLRDGKFGLGAVALASLMQSTGRARGTRHSPMARAKNVIYLHMSGGPPQQELFDFKPELVKRNMQPCPESLLANQRFAFIKGHPNILGTPYKFAQHGESGSWISELLPNVARHADDLAVVRSMWTDQFNHAPAEMFLFTGSPNFGGASLGS